MLKALGLAADQMTGAVNTANTAWQQNTALTNEANKRYATAQSRLTMMQNAYNNLKVAIGDAYTPRSAGAYGIRHEGPQQHYGVHSEEPGVGQCHHRLCRRDRRGRRRAGCLCGRCKDSRSRQCHSQAAIPGVNVIMGVTAAVAAITAGIVALATAAANDAVPV